MLQAPDILSVAYKQPVMYDQMELLQEKEQQIPGSIQYTIRRYRKHPLWNMEDTGMVVYEYHRDLPKGNILELRFCVSGNIYCKEKEIECDRCKLNASR